jgi:hypothetical protein
MSFSPNLFLSNMKAKGGPAKTNRFEVILPIPTYIGEFIPQSFFEQLLNFPNTLTVDVSSIFGQSPKTDESREDANPSLSRYLALQCETAELPGKTLQTADAKVYGPSFKVPYQTQYQDMTLTFLCTNDFYERKLFERWINAIMPSDTNNLRFANDNDNKTRYMTTLKVIQYNDFVKQIYAVDLIDAFPIGVASQQLSWSDDNIHRLSVQFAYQKYKPIYDGVYDTNAIFNALLGTVGSRVQSAAGSAVSNALGGITSRIPGLGGGF